MKKTFLYGLMCAAVALAGVVSCTKDDPQKGNNGDNGGNDGDQTGTTYTLIASPQSLSFGWSNPAPQSVTVTTNAPEGFEVGTTADWFTAEKEGNKVVVTPQTNDGEKRTYELEIKAQGANSVKILISQEPKGEVHASLTGSEYFVWQLGASSLELLGTKVIQSFAEDPTLERNFYIWENTLLGAESVGPNFYGNQDGYMCLKVGTVGWSGAGYTAPEAAISTMQRIIDANGEGWYFHAAIKGTKGAGDSFALVGNGDDHNYAINWDDYLGDDSNEWYEVEIPMSDICAAGWNLPAPGNTLAVYGGGTADNMISYDALFIYKK